MTNLIMDEGYFVLRQSKMVVEGLNCHSAQNNFGDSVSILILETAHENIFWD